MDSLSKLYYINSGQNGTFAASGNGAYDSVPADVDAIFKYLTVNDKKSIAVYFHGGLVDAESGMETAKRFTKKTLEKNNVHPVSFIWETGPLETIKQNLGSVVTTPFAKAILKRVIKIAGDQLGIDAATLVGTKSVGGMGYSEIETELSREAPFDNYSIDEGKKAANRIETLSEVQLKNRIHAEVENEFDSDNELKEAFNALSDEEKKILSPELFDESNGEGTKGLFSWLGVIEVAIKIIYKVIKRHLEKRDHGFYPTIIEEVLREVFVADVGSWMWGAMKDKACNMWTEDPSGTAPEDLHTGAYFLKKLAEFSENRVVTLDLIGHSAGSIAICHMVAELQRLNIQDEIRNIIFMAPACRSELFNDTIVTNSHRVQNFRMFTMFDYNEIKDHLVPFVYTRSLLYLISGILEKDENDAYILGMERYHHGKKPYDGDLVLESVRAFFEAGENRTIYAVTDDGAPEGLRSSSLKHGAFDDDKEITMDSIAYILSK
ncbi:hypothetical protein Flavo103_27170 [Flavobacterium collinsii]|uniref:alpha/beta hydrolase n=1 Tax=Flavobacterium collinsii TaxID=1114861 RepID=UPI0022C91BB8|nr:alpha/beta hydrolase [Flavobacterium collinsii]GIQ59581.1 hypothetical protein Flavo103_27170 [Flavobacterium collinsii]